MKRLIFFVAIATFIIALTSCGECKHSFAPATCDSASYCTLCGVTSGEPLSHVMSNATCAEPATCQLCGAKGSTTEDHSFKGATCQLPATCEICGKTAGEPLEHAFLPATCTAAKKCQLCGIKDGEALGHDYAEATCFVPKQCTVCGSYDGFPLEHNFVSQSCVETPVCSLCGTVGTASDHTWQAATCHAPEHCAVCNETRGEALTHDWIQESCSKPRYCSLCGDTTTEGIVHELVLENCLLPLYCKYCSYSEPAPGHDWQEATCALPYRCAVCKRAQGSPLGHELADANCDDPKHCIRCDYTEGEALGHDWYYVSTIPASCGPGAHVYGCEKCQKTKREQFASDPTQYHLCNEEGLCSTCGSKFDVEQMTLVGLFSSDASVVTKPGIYESPETTNKICKTFSQSELGLPIVDISGDISKASTNGYIEVFITYESEDKSFESIAQIRVQGASSAGRPKKNYSVKLYDPDGTKNKVKVVEDWGKQFKYCLKANWIDYSQARNVVSGQLYGDVIDSRSFTDELTDLPSGGAIDGFPCVVYNNGQFLGLYTFNIPKDKWMFDMKDTDEKNQAIVMAITWNEEVAMRKQFTYNEGVWTGSGGWELEYASNEDSEIDNSTSWVAESLNNLIKFVLENDGEDFKNGIHDYLDVDKTIDSILHTFLILADDNVSKNVLWATYDGVHWFSSVYDMDGTWGMKWDGSIPYKDAKRHPISNLANNVPGQSGYNYQYNLLWEKIYINFYDQLVERYWELRESVYTMEHITELFEAFFNQIPDFVRKAEREKWTSVPSQGEDHLAQILDFAKKRLDLLDSTLVP